MLYIYLQPRVRPCNSLEYKKNNFKHLEGYKQRYKLEIYYTLRFLSFFKKKEYLKRNEIFNKTSETNRNLE